MRDRRSYLKAITVPAIAGLAGCSGDSESQTTPTQSATEDATSAPATETARESIRPRGESTWPMHRHDTGLTGFTPEYGPVADFSIDWSWPENRNNFQPIFDESQFYVTAGAVRAVSGDGVTQWGQQVIGRMPVVVDGTLVMSHEKRMVAWETSTGQREWVTDPVLAGYTGPLQARDGLVYATVDTGAGVGVTTFDIDSGEQKWSISHEGLSVRYPPLPAISAEKLYLPRGKPEIEVHDATSGEQVDTIESGGAIHDVVIGTDHVNDDGTLYVLSKAEDDGDFVRAIDPSTGETLWNTQVTFDHSEYAPVPTLTVDPDSVYVPTEGRLVALDRATGQERWDAPVERAIDETIVAAGNAVYIVTSDRKLRVFDYRTGEESASLSFEDPIYGLAVFDDRVFVSTNQVHAISGATSV